MHSLITALLSASLITALSISAYAEAPAAPAFTLMDPTGDGSRAGLEMAAVTLSGEADSVTLLRNSVTGQYVAPEGLGVYLGIAATLLLLEDANGGDGGAGNLEIGGLYHRALTPELDLGVRVGTILPTGGDSLVHALGTGLSRPADLATAIPDIGWLRLGVSPALHHGAFALRADIGADIALNGDDAGERLWHVNVGAGLRFGSVSTTAEVQTLLSPDNDDDNIHVAGLSVRHHGARVSPYLMVSMPLNDGLAGDIATVMGGLTASL